MGDQPLDPQEMLNINANTKIPNKKEPKLSKFIPTIAKKEGSHESIFDYSNYIFR